MSCSVMAEDKASGNGLVAKTVLCSGRSIVLVRLLSP